MLAYLTEAYSAFEWDWGIHCDIVIDVQNDIITSVLSDVISLVHLLLLPVTRGTAMACAYKNILIEQSSCILAWVVTVPLLHSVL